MTYHRLENSIIDVIKEEQAKLGYRKEEIRLYYPLSSLDHFFETEADAEEMKKILAGFGAYTKEKLGNVLVIKGIDFVSIYRSRAQNMCMRI